MIDNKLKNARKRFMKKNVAPDRIIEEVHFNDMSEFVTSTGGDVCKYRVYGGEGADFILVAK